MDKTHEERAGGAVRRGQHPVLDGGRVGPSDVVPVRGAPAAVRSRTIAVRRRGPGDPGNDRFVLSKGHASPLFFSVLKAIGAIDDGQLLSFRSSITCPRSRARAGHAVDVATDRWGRASRSASAWRSPWVSTNCRAAWVLMGDSEAEDPSGRQWNVLPRRANPTGILDMNRLASGPTMLEWTATATRRAPRRSGGGHWRRRTRRAAIDAAYRQAETEGPTLIVAKTEKGHGVSFLANKEGWVGKARPPTRPRRRSPSRAGRATLLSPAKAGRPRGPRAPWRPGRRWSTCPATTRHRQPARRSARRWRHGRPPRHRGARRRGGQLDAHRGPEGRSERFFERYIAEQVARRRRRLSGGREEPVRRDVRRVPDALLRLRAHGRGQSREPVPVRSHAGVSIGEDGLSQMALSRISR